MNAWSADGMPDTVLPEAAWWVALASLPLVGPARLTAMHGQWSGETAWWELCRGHAHGNPALAACMGREPGELSARWARAGSATSVTALWERHRVAGIGVAVLGQRDYPEAFAVDPDPPVVVFSDGHLPAPASASVAVVGTRRATRYGLELAQEIGAELAGAGVCVVSGLALGIDGAAHRGCLAARVDPEHSPYSVGSPRRPAPPSPGASSPAGSSPTASSSTGTSSTQPTTAPAPPIAVVGSGLDVCYPTANRGLWREVAKLGVVLSEAPLGVRPERWRFPARNRLIAALADVVLVVESPERGGSLLTVDSAAERGVPVMAVPGSVRSRASAGTNQLLLDGAGVARHAGDVLEVLGLATAGPVRSGVRPDPRSPEERAVLDALGWQAATLQQLAERTDLDLGLLSVILGQLVDQRWVATGDGWFERTSGSDS